MIADEGLCCRPQMLFYEINVLSIIKSLKTKKADTLLFSNFIIQPMYSATEERKRIN